MNKEERAKKLEKQMSHVRRVGIAVERSRQLSKAMKTRETQMEERRKAKAESGKGKRKPWWEDKSFDEILDGTFIERAVYLINVINYKGFYSYDGPHLSLKEVKKFGSTFTPTDMSIFRNEICDIVDNIVKYGKIATAMRSAWQALAAVLSTSLTRWKSVEDMAAMLNRTLMEDTNLANKMAENANKVIADSFSDMTPPVIVFNEDTHLFTANIDQKGGLYKNILSRQATAKEQLANLKATIEPFSDFIYSEVPLCNGEMLPLWAVTPPSILTILTNPELISFNKKEYFHIYLKHMKEEGKEITPEMEKKAVIPSYTEIEPNPTCLKMAVLSLSETFPNYYTPKPNE